MTNAEIQTTVRVELRSANSTVITKFKELKAAIIEATYEFDKQAKLATQDMEDIIMLRNNLEKLATQYCKLYEKVEKQTGHVGI